MNGVSGLRNEHGSIPTWPTIAQDFKTAALGDCPALLRLARSRL